MIKLSIQDIAVILVEKNGLKKREANSFVSTMFGLIQERLGTDRQVKVKGLGTFKIVDVEARESVSVQTGERVLIDSHSKVSFTPDATMKELVNKPFSQFETVILNDGVEFNDLTEDTDDDVQSEESEEQELTAESEKVPVTEIETTETAEEAETTEEAEKTETAEETKLSEDVQPVVDAKPTEDTETVVKLEVSVSPEVEIEPLVNIKPEKKSEPVIEEETPQESEPPTTEIPVALVNPKVPEVSEPAEEPQPTEDLQPTAELKATEDSEETAEQDAWSDDMDEDDVSKKYYWLFGTFTVLALMALSAWGGYYYGSKQQAVISDTIMVRDTILVAPADTVKTLAGITDAELASPTDVKETVGHEPKTEPVQPVSKTEPAVKETKPQAVNKTTPVETVDKYAEKDSRIRLGAYRIVGLDYEVKVQPGQTFYSICKGNLGPDMECYVEVYNDLPRNPKLKVGQVIKIPKLQVKKRKK